MANASKTHIGPGSQGKGAGVGGLTDTQDDRIGDNQVLGNRDKSRHGDERGLDSKAVQVEQLQDNPANRDVAPPTDAEDKVSGPSEPKSDTSGDKA